MAADDDMAFAVLLRRCRNEARLTQEELASKSGLSVRSVSDMERGRTAKPYRRSVALLAEALGLAGDARVVFLEAARAGWSVPIASASAGGPAGGLARPVQPEVVPRQMPAAARHFVGREPELAELNAALVEPAGDGAAKIAAISGAAGVGKTGLALHWGHGVASRFPDGQLYADLRGYDTSGVPVPPHVVLDQFLRALGVPGERVPRESDERSALFRSLLHGRQVLIVLDNARSTDQVRPLLPGSGHCFVLVTSRNRLDDLVAHDDARLLHLDVLTRHQARELLSKAAGEGRIDWVTAARIAALCDRLPLALRIAAARLAMRPHDTAPELVTRLADERRRLQALSHIPGGIRVSFALSYRELPDRAAGLFRLLSLLVADDFATWAAAALLGEAEERAEGVLDTLVRASLVEMIGIDSAGQLRYRLHDLIRLYARERCDAEDSFDVRDRALRRLFGGALYLSGEADSRLGNPFISPLGGDAIRFPLEDSVVRLRAAPVAWFDAEHRQLTGAVAQACKLGMAEYGWELTSALSQYLSTSRRVGAWRTAIGHALSAARTAGDARGEAAMLLQHADMQVELGLASEAIANLERARSLLTRCADVDGQAICWTLLALGYRELGQLTRARRAALQAMALLGTSTPPAVRGRALVMLGLTHLDQDRRVAAAGCFRRFSRIQQAAGNVRGQAEARYYLAMVRLRQRRHDAAVRLLTLAMNSARQSGDHMQAMTAQIRLAQALVELGRLDQARPLLEEAVRRVSPDNSPRFRAIALESLGQLHSARGEAAAAAPLIAEARLLRRELPANAPR